MSCYYIRIIDTQADPENNYVVTGFVNPGYTTQQLEEGGLVGAGELVAARSVKLSHRGGDRLDVPIIGSSLSWTFVGLDCSDGRYQHLFTGDENRFEVKLFDEDDNIIWTGYLLPDSYQEPYRNFVQDVSFQAVDGLGRLKGKFLPFIQPEMDVIDIIVSILRLTGVFMPLRFAPAIVNYGQPDYKQIWVTTEGWESRDAYDILMRLMESMASSLYQADGFWNVEGWNVRPQTNYWVEIYGTFGIHQGGEMVSRQVKKAQTLKGGNITMVPPYGVLEISHNRTQQSLAEGLHQPRDKDWVSYSGAGIEDTVYADEWVMSEEYPILFDGDRVFFEREGAGQDESPFSLKRRPYVVEGGRYVLTMGFSIDAPDVMQDYSLRNPFDYEVLVGDEVLYTNIDGLGVIVSMTFTEEEDSVELRFEFVARTSGLLNVVLHPLKSGGGVAAVTKAVVEDMTLERIGFEETQRVVRISNENYTSKKEVLLEYADDVTGASRGFRLAKLDAPSGSVPFNVPIDRDFQLGDEWVSIVDLRSAELVNNNIESVTGWMGAVVEIDRVEFNWLGSQEHALITRSRIARPIEGDLSLTVHVNAYNPLPGPRQFWGAWSDSVYKIEQNGYAETYANILQRMYGQPLERADLPVWENVKINDVLEIDYEGAKTWVLSDCVWNVDQGVSEVVASQSVYAAKAMPPAVEIGGERYIVSDSVELTAEGYSPTGAIVSYFWEILEGDGSFNPNTSPTTVVSLVDSRVKVRVTVTDENGLQAFDEATIYRRVDTDLRWEEEAISGLRRRFRLELSNPIPDDYVILLRGSADLMNYNRDNGVDFVGAWLEDKAVLRARLNPNIDDQSSEYLNGSLEFSLPIRNGSELVVELGLREPLSNEPQEKKVTFEVVHSYYAEGFGEVSRPPKLELSYNR